jgi:hypothetical protein
VCVVRRSKGAAEPSISRVCALQPPHLICCIHTASKAAKVIPKSGSPAACKQQPYATVHSRRMHVVFFPPRVLHAGCGQHHAHTSCCNCSRMTAQDTSHRQHTHLRRMLQACALHSPHQPVQSITQGRTQTRCSNTYSTCSPLVATATTSSAATTCSREVQQRTTHLWLHARPQHPTPPVNCCCTRARHRQI